MTEANNEIELARTHAQNANAWAKTFMVESQETATLAGEWLLAAKAAAKCLDDRRKEITAPLLAAKASTDELFKPVIAVYLEIESILKSKIAVYTTQIDTQRRETMALTAAEFANGGTPTTFAAEPVRVQGVSVSQVWDFEVTDPAQVPRELCSPDDYKIKAFMKLHGVAVNIPGIRFVQKDKVIARVKK